MQVCIAAFLVSELRRVRTLLKSENGYDVLTS